MTIEVKSLSTLHSPELSSALDNFTFKQFHRTLEGGLSMNFANALSAIEDFESKNYSNFYLSTNRKATDLFNFENSPIINEKMTTKLMVGRLYWKVENISIDSYKEANRYQESFNYRQVSFDDEGSYFELVFLDDNNCNIYFYENGIKFILCSDEANSLFFIKDTLKPSSESTNPSYNFKYMYGEDRDFIYFYQKNTNGEFSLKKSGDTIILDNIEDNISTLNNRIKLSRTKTYRPSFTINSDFIRYSDNNDVDVLKDENLPNNYLIHKKIYKSERNYSDVIILKNQFSETGKSIQGNNLLSGDSSLIQYGENRLYTSIFDDMLTENGETLELNYVFYNKDYEIKPGINTFTAPSSMSPFNTLNVNDTKFIQCGAFSYITPEYADKIFQTNENQISENGQYFLCTWLSGFPDSDEKIWVDRYYYPDLIDKQTALAGKSLYDVTYDDYIENLILTNSTLSSSVASKKIIDKKSDLVFRPNNKYTYQRIQKSDFASLSTIDNGCSLVNTLNFLDYKKLNRSGKFTLSFYFKDNGEDWNLKSDHNEIETYLKIDKSGNDITFTYKLYDPPTASYTNFIVTSKTEKFKTNFVSVSFNSITGKYSVFFNDIQLLKDETDPVQYANKSILRGNFKFNGEDLNSNNILYNIRMLDEFTTPELAFIRPIIDGESEINDITITLPCGMRNNSDIINLIQSACKSESFKSNNINVYLKNLGINNDNIIAEMKNQLESDIGRFLPVNSKVNTIQTIN